MKIVQVLATDGGKIGGLEKHTFQLCAKLSEKQEVHLFLDLNYRNEIPKLEHLHCHYFDFSKGRMNIGLLYSLFKEIRKVGPDIVHAQGGKASKILSFLIPFLKVPSVATIHGMKNNMRSYRHFDEVITVSQAVGDKASEYRPVHVIYNGVAQEKSLTDDIPRTSLKKAIAIGRLDPVKGFDRLIEAWQDFEVQLEILGEGPEHERLSQLIKDLHLQDKIKLVGYQHDIYPYLAASDLVVVSSLKEGGPLIVAEALLVHKPIIATNVGMVREFIPEKYIAKDNTVLEINNLIKVAIKNFEHIQHDFKPAFDKAKAELSLNAMVSKTVDIYNLALKQQR
ncbi:glycosyltransferase [Acinetobacter baumannii]|uniref:glycosyltransferase n=1 Tax=Acinetobacter baumannii TaxID=470 RepID=UPI00186BB1D6|nr:glycosyltransferase [Acinetobacter baumannii]MBE4723669.1 glycosyltransferase [Acinetobacter baumannii]MDH2527614.1 glycosyltransferase [Acinetobacter baumannii]MDN8268160.1 glycosyltransferase [Acinetobacter baumannii]